MIKNSREEFLNISKKKKIICFGGGRALKTINAFLEAEKCMVTFLVDNERNKWGTYTENMQINSPEILEDCRGEEYLILISSTKYADEIEKQLCAQYGNKFEIFKWPLKVTEYKAFDETLWYERIYKTCEHMYEQVAEWMPEEERKSYLRNKKEMLKDGDKLVLPRTPLMITTRCTLCCKECSNLMPYYKNPMDYPADDIIMWIKNVCDAVDEWICLELVGGEPFLYKELKKIFEYVLAEKKIQQIEFTTNGSVIPKKEIIELLKNEKVFVKISLYPNQIDVSKWISLLETEKIHYNLLENMSWIRTGELTSRGRNRCELQSQFLNCGISKFCRTILNGRLYVCSKAASLMELGYAEDLEMVDLTQKVGLRKRIKAFLQLNYSEACNYCDIASEEEEVVEPAVQVKR